MLAGTLTYDGTSQGAIDVGTSAIQPGGLTSQNYAIAFGPGTLTIHRADLTVTVNPAAKPYDGQAFRGGSVSFAGFVNGESSEVLGGTPVYGGNAQGAVDAGSYNLTVEGLTSPNYEVRFVPGLLSVFKAVLSVTAEDVRKTFDGQAFSGGNLTYTGFVAGETPAVIEGAPVIGGSAQGRKDAGTYTIVPTPGTLAARNYAFAFIGGVLNIERAVLTVQAADASKTYDGQAYAGGNGGVFDGFVPGESESVLAGSLGLGGSAQGAVQAGSYGIVPGGLASNNYAIAFVPGTLTVHKATLTVTAADASRRYAEANPGFTATLGGFVNGEDLATSGVAGSQGFTTTATATSAPGAYPIVAGPGTLSASNYTFRFTDGALSVTPAELALPGFSVNSLAGSPFTGAVFSFATSAALADPGAYLATIDWGDGTSSTGTIAGSGGTLTVSGSKTYASPETYPVSVQIRHRLGYANAATASGTMAVASLGQGVTAGQSATMEFWNGTRGQALIKSFNAGPADTGLSGWLASTFPKLYGAAEGGKSMIGRTNAGVAATFSSLYALGGSRYDAEVLATALNVYATTLSLGGTAARAYGFTVSLSGLGARSYDVGINGAAFGVPNNSIRNVYQLLQAVNDQAVNGMLDNGSNSLLGKAKKVLGGINKAGGIKK